MTRIIKETNERRNEILDAAETLIAEKGYLKTTTIDILNQVGIAKDTLYYYFKSKEGVMDATIEHLIEQGVQETQLIAMDKSISPVRRICRIIVAGQLRTDGPKDRMIEKFHLPVSALMHKKSIVHLILALSPILGEIASQRVEERLLSTERPLETMQMPLVSERISFDSSMFTWAPCEMEQRINGFIEVMETVLGAEKGTFEPIGQILAAGSGYILQESESRRDEWWQIVPYREAGISASW